MGLFLVFLMALVGYLIGSIPIGYILGRFKGKDIRKHGSGNIGASNVARTLGLAWGIFVFVLDFAKGFISLAILEWLLFGPAFVHKHIGEYEIILLLSPILGNIYPFYMNFKGGKAVSCSAGVLAYASPVILLCTLLVFAVVFGLRKIVSMASLVAALSLPCMAALLFYVENKNGYTEYFLRNSTLVQMHKHQFVFLLLVLSGIIIYRHLENVSRLIQGKEPNFRK